MQDNTKCPLKRKASVDSLDLSDDDYTEEEGFFQRLQESLDELRKESTIMSNYLGKVLQQVGDLSCSMTLISEHLHLRG